MVAGIGTDLLTKGVNYQTKPTPFGLVSNWFTNQPPNLMLLGLGSEVFDGSKGMGRPNRATNNLLVFGESVVESLLLLIASSPYFHVCVLERKR